MINQLENQKQNKQKAKILNYEVLMNLQPQTF